MISFLAGKPNPSTFPFESITLKIKSDGHADASGKANGAPIPSQPEELTISGDRLNEALQYGATAGLPSLVKVSSAIILQYNVALCPRTHTLYLSFSSLTIVAGKLPRTRS